MAKALVLTVITGPQIGRRHVLSERVNTIGSAGTSHFAIYDRQIAARHAEVRLMLDRWFIVPIATNGISLNGLPVTGQGRLNPGDKLTLGTTTYQVSYEELAEREVGSADDPGDRGDVPRLGEYLVERGLLTREQQTRVVRRQVELEKTGVRPPFGQVAFELGFISRGQLESALAQQRSEFNDRFRD